MHFKTKLQKIWNKMRIKSTVNFCPLYVSQGRTLYRHTMHIHLYRHVYLLWDVRTYRIKIQINKQIKI